MELAGKSLGADVTRPFRSRHRNGLWHGKSHAHVVCAGMEESRVLFQFFRRPESEVGDGAVREGAAEGTVVAVDVEVAAFGVLEAFVEVVAGHLGTFVSFVAIECSDVLLFLHKECWGRSEVFKQLSVPDKHVAESFEADVVPCFKVLLLMEMSVTPRQL